jgi:hypothetical protein
MGMFKINKNILFAIDSSGVAIFDKENHISEFLTYPEAGVWLVFSEGHNQAISVKILESVLMKKTSETKRLVKQCLEIWRNKAYID